MNRRYLKGTVVALAIASMVLSLWVGALPGVGGAPGLWVAIGLFYWPLILIAASSRRTDSRYIGNATIARRAVGFVISGGLIAAAGLVLAIPQPDGIGAFFFFIGLVVVALGLAWWASTRPRRRRRGLRDS